MPVRSLEETAGETADNSFLARFSVIRRLVWCLLVVMRTPAGADPDLATVIAACHGDRGALDALVAGYLPLVYNVVAVTLAYAGLMSPLVCAVFMPLTSLSTVLSTVASLAPRSSSWRS